ncbi:flavodoxin family protein [Clostridium butanoliproducens]|uniref:flavodoxin family protein n=1 Tax=Clostridium butanoliproducens TaxID=2991837 RepID=UPI0024B8824B|nr:NAD(P)H-dependent oxidoreductase [Clostridium butanoliproducens]MDU1348758.1 NAD(P)H-dependent oxidoreductase [Clostridium argentinense]
MRALLLSFSGRKDPGNCIKILEFIKREIAAKYMDSFLLNITELKISPCLRCNYECFNKDLGCMINDDVEYVYKEILSSDILIMCVPVYSSAPPSIYFSLRERGQSFFKTDELFMKYANVKKLYIIIGKKISGGMETIEILLNDDKNATDDDVLLLESNEFGQKSIEGNLINCDEVKNRVRDFLSRKLAERYQL